MNYNKLPEWVVDVRRTTEDRLIYTNGDKRFCYVEDVDRFRVTGHEDYNSLIIRAKIVSMRPTGNNLPSIGAECLGKVDGEFKKVDVIYHMFNGQNFVAACIVSESNLLSWISEFKEPVPPEIEELVTDLESIEGLLESLGLDVTFIAEHLYSLGYRKLDQ